MSIVTIKMIMTMTMATGTRRRQSYPPVLHVRLVIRALMRVGYDLPLKNFVGL